MIGNNIIMICDCPHCFLLNHERLDQSKCRLLQLLGFEFSYFILQRASAAAR